MWTFTFRIVPWLVPRFQNRSRQAVHRGRPGGGRDAEGLERLPGPPSRFRAVQVDDRPALNNDVPMANLVRFGIAMETELLERFDELVERRGAANRSEALRDLIRKELTEDAWAGGRSMVATITLVYDHHVRELTERLTEIQHDHGDLIISTLHIHLDHDHCLEIVAVKGKSKEVQILADTLKAVKGVKHGTLSMTGTGKDIG